MRAINRTYALGAELTATGFDAGPGRHGLALCRAVWDVNAAV
ncbi:hypothetical protein ACIQGO_27945 [Streptomyces shenzhenensis]